MQWTYNSLKPLFGISSLIPNHENYASSIALVYHRQTLVIQLEYCLSQELYYFLISSVLFQFIQ